MHTSMTINQEERPDVFRVTPFNLLSSVGINIAPPRCFLMCCHKTLFLSDLTPILCYACHQLTHWLPFSKLDWCDPGMCRWQLNTCCWSCCCCWWWGLCRFGSWGLVIKLNFFSSFEDKIHSRFWSWSSGKIWSWSLVSMLLLMFCRGNEVDSLSRFWSQVWTISWILSLVEMLMFVMSRFWSCCLVNILKMKFDQILCLNLLKISYFGRPNSTLGSVVPLNDY